jgi:glycosyltransferase involved in cell wall biosynthesis
LNFRGIDLKKIIAFAHGQWDMYNAQDLDYKRLAGFACISNSLQDTSRELKTNVVPIVVPIGIHAPLFKDKCPTKIQRVGYGGSMEHHNFNKIEIKRGRLVKIACELAGVEFCPPTGKIKNLAMPAYYKTVDAVVMSSIEEAGGLPMMEAAASSKLCLGTDVGYFADNPTGVHLPFQEDQFVESLVYNIHKLNSDSIELKSLCSIGQEFAWKNYNWPEVIKKWIQFLKGVHDGN